MKAQIIVTNQVQHTNHSDVIHVKSAYYMICCKVTLILAYKMDPLYV
jgi:hypothetical protein